MTTRTATPTAHIWLAEQGRACIDEIVEEHYRALTLAQVRAALAYYDDNQGSPGPSSSPPPSRN
jgi:uncharacterized protein (DUF433 family)